MNVLKSIFCISSVLLLISCSKQPQTDFAPESNLLADHSNVAENHHHGNEKNSAYSYQKPGASVRFSHSYDGDSVVGEQEDIKLTFDHAYEAGVMSIQLESQGGLLMENSSLHTFALADASQFEIDTILSAAQEGKYYLTAFVTVDDLRGNPMSRVFELAVYVGDSARSDKSALQPAHMSIEKAASGETVIMMQAEETISQ